MRSKRLAFYLLTVTVLCTHVGCSQTGAVRSSPSTNMRTVASVGDKPLPSVSGEPGAALRVDTEDTDLPPSSGSRISGRVYDERGKPVPNAKVRLAVSSSPGGKVVYATTDRSGAFTLRGLRPGSSYTVIAEYQGEDGMMTGRTQAKAAQVDVRISLKPRNGESSQGHASIEPARPRVAPISNIDPVDDEPSDEGRSPGRVNAEDLELPADDAASLTPRRNVRLSRAVDNRSSAPARAGWSSRQVSSGKAATPAARSENPTEDLAPEAPRSAVRDQPGVNADDDGPNPLPPALDTTEVFPRRSTVTPSDDVPVRVARGSTRSLAGTRRRSTASSRAQDDDRTTTVVDDGGEREPRSMPDDILPGARLITPGSSAPIAVNESSDDEDRPARSTRGSHRSPAPPAGRATNPPDDADSSEPPESPAIHGTSSSNGRPTWRELARNQSEVPLDESIRRTAGEVSSADHAVVTLTSKTPAPRSGLTRMLGASQPATDHAVKPAVCRFDPSTRRLVDFQLPGLDGKTVSLHDIDADVILLDFWGSWCAPCRTSIPHLAELQATLGPKRLQVIGVACEKGASLQDRRASASKAVQELGIRYPVLLSSKDGTCPVQQALQIQFYPTMILVDRDGKLLAREQGATEVTLSRMDRAINTALRSDGGPVGNERVIR